MLGLIALAMLSAVTIFPLPSVSAQTTPDEAGGISPSLSVALRSTQIIGIQSPSGEPSPKKAEAQIVFYLTAQGQDIYIPFPQGITLNTNGEFTAWAILINEPGKLVDGLLVIPPGQGVLITALGTITTPKAGFKGMRIDKIRWGATPNESNARVLNTRKILKTPQIYLYAQ